MRMEESDDFESVLDERKEVRKIARERERKDGKRKGHVN